MNIADDATTETRPQQEFAPPQAESRIGEPGRPVDTEQPTTRRSTRKSLWIVTAIAVGAVAAVVVLGALYASAANERDDSEQALSETEADLLDSEADLVDSEANLVASEARVTEYREATADWLAMTIAMGAGVTEDEATCIAEAMIESRGPEALGLVTDAASSGAMELGVEMKAAAPDCGVPLDTFDTQNGFSYGDNTTLDALYDECENGAGASCDALYRQSDVGTEYETFGLTCGSRFEPGDAPPSCEASI